MRPYPRIMSNYFSHDIVDYWNRLFRYRPIVFYIFSDRSAIAHLSKLRSCLLTTICQLDLDNLVLELLDRRW